MPSLLAGLAGSTPRKGSAHVDACVDARNIACVDVRSVNEAWADCMSVELILWYIRVCKS